MLNGHHSIQLVQKQKITTKQNKRNIEKNVKVYMYSSHSTFIPNHLWFYLPDVFENFFLHLPEKCNVVKVLHCPASYMQARTLLVMWILIFVQVTFMFSLKCQERYVMNFSTDNFSATSFVVLIFHSLITVSFMHISFLWFSNQHQS